MKDVIFVEVEDAIRSNVLMGAKKRFTMVLTGGSRYPDVVREESRTLEEWLKSAVDKYGDSLEIAYLSRYGNIPRLLIDSMDTAVESALKRLGFHFKRFDITIEYQARVRVRAL